MSLIQSLISSDKYGVKCPYLMTPKGIYAARDKYGRTPMVIGKKEEAYCLTFEDFAYRNLGYEDFRELGPGEIVVVTQGGVKT